MATGQVAAASAGTAVGANVLAPIVLYYSQVRGFQPPMDFDVAFALGSVIAVIIATVGTFTTLLIGAWWKRKFGTDYPSKEE